MKTLFGKGRQKKKSHQPPLTGASFDTYNFVVAFIDAESGQEVYAAPALSASDVEHLARWKFPRWGDRQVKDKEDKPVRPVSPHILKDKGQRIEVLIDPWIAQCVRSR